MLAHDLNGLEAARQASIELADRPSPALLFGVAGGRVAVGYRALAEATMLAHLTFLLFLATGGFLAWRRRRVIVPHVLVAGWGLVTATVGVECPLTLVEDWAATKGGRAPGPTLGWWCRSRRSAYDWVVLLSHQHRCRDVIPPMTTPSPPQRRRTSRLIAAGIGAPAITGFVAALITISSFYAALGISDRWAELWAVIGALAPALALSLVGWLLFQRGRRYLPVALWAGVIPGLMLAAAILTDTLAFTSLAV